MFRFRVARHFLGIAGVSNIAECAPRNTPIAVVEEPDEDDEDEEELLLLTKKQVIERPRRKHRSELIKEHAEMLKSELQLRVNESLCYPEPPVSTVMIDSCPVSTAYRWPGTVLARLRWLFIGNEFGFRSLEFYVTVQYTMMAIATALLCSVISTVKIIRGGTETPFLKLLCQKSLRFVGLGLATCYGTMVPLVLLVVFQDRLTWYQFFVSFFIGTQFLIPVSSEMHSLKAIIRIRALNGLLRTVILMLVPLFSLHLCNRDRFNSIYTDMRHGHWNKCLEKYLEYHGLVDAPKSRQELDVD